jgi:PhzF family phenazine biosynthesis protein
MRLPLYQIDAFADAVFGGNPAAVVPLDSWLDDVAMQAIAAENNLSETAFFVREGEGWRLRWFTPTFEIDLCGHATLATAWLISEMLEPGRTRMRFHTRSGALDVARDGVLLTLDFPSRPPQPCSAPPGLAAALGRPPRETGAARDYLCVYGDEADVRALAPDMTVLTKLDRMVIVTAPGRDCDFVSRFFAPGAGVPEDPVTGSAHCTLIPYWAQRLGKARLNARQLSKRGGVLVCEDRGERVAISGRCVLYLEGTIRV